MWNSKVLTYICMVQDPVLNNTCSPPCSPCSASLAWQRVFFFFMWLLVCFSARLSARLGEHACSSVVRNRYSFVFKPNTCAHLCHRGGKHECVCVRQRLWLYSRMHCRPCFFCRVLLHSEQVAQLEKEPGTKRCPLLLLPLPPHSLSLASFSFCCSFSRFLPCRGTREKYIFMCKFSIKDG